MQNPMIDATSQFGSPRILIIHSAASHSGKTTLCRALARDLPFDTYVKLSRHTDHLVERSLSAGNLGIATGDTSLLLSSRRTPGLLPLRDVLFCSGPRDETDGAVMRALVRWGTAVRVLVEGNCSVAPIPSLHLFVLSCPLPSTCKPDTGTSASGAGLLVVNRLPSCSAAEERALATLLHEWNPCATVLSGSLEDSIFLATVEGEVVSLLPMLLSR
jgi:hypothetical protein